MAARQERMARACAAVKSLYGVPATAAGKAIKQLLPFYNNKWELVEHDNYNVVYRYIKKKILKNKEDKNTELKRGDSENDESLTGKRRRISARNNVEEINDNLQSEVYDKNVILLKYVESHLHPSKRSKTSNSGTTKDKEKEDDFLQVQDYDHALSDPVNKHLTDTVSSENKLESFAKDQGQPKLSHESEFETPLAVPTQDGHENLCEFGSSSAKSTNIKVDASSSEFSHDSKTQFDIISSANGAVKISLLFNSQKQVNLESSKLKEITKEVENKYRKLYGITDPGFSIMNLMKDICNCTSEMDEGDGKKEDLSRTTTKHPKHLQDIARGEERVRIPLVNENGAMELPKFFYIPKNIPYNDAYVNFSLARISSESCCSQCTNDCLSSKLPCECAAETRGEFAYTPGGLLKETFLDEAITMSQGPKKHHLYYCEHCPLENNHLEKKKRKRSCKGHLMRNFIKECWNKCGCNKKHCSNRVVQRGITAALEVFSTPEGKGWGLRSVNALKKGEFVCEYVGEIVTNQELHVRNKQRTGKAEHTYPVLLDADWGSERVLKDEEALCLDATEYGNCARFINHRCVDANLVEIPVEIETPDHHYYHLAFFTARDIKPMEELTWDYGIHFDDKKHPIKAFRCKCGSIFCRDK